MYWAKCPIQMMKEWLKFRAENSDRTDRSVNQVFNWPKMKNRNRNRNGFSSVRFEFKKNKTLLTGIWSLANGWEKRPANHLRQLLLMFYMFVKKYLFWKWWWSWKYQNPEWREGGGAGPWRSVAVAASGKGSSAEIRVVGCVVWRRKRRAAWLVLSGSNRF